MWVKVNYNTWYYFDPHLWRKMMITPKTPLEMDLIEMDGNKPKLMQHLSDMQKAILIPLGGGIGDIPMDDEHPYHHLQRKIMRLSTLG